MVIPRLNPVDADGNLVETDDLEFLGDLQREIEHAGLPWDHIEFAPDAGDLSGLAIEVDTDVDGWSVVRDLGAVVAQHAQSVLTTLLAAAGEPVEISQLLMGIDSEWTVEPERYPALLEWLNTPFGARAPISLDALTAGTVEQDRYVPPASLRAAFEVIAGDRLRCLAAHVLARALLTGDPLWLNQSDDSFQRVIWDRQLDANPGAAVALYRPVDYPILDLLAESFGLPVALREYVFYAYVGPDVDLPPEDATAPAHLRSGFGFAEYVAEELRSWAAHRMSAQRENAYLQFGWHAGGTAAEVTKAFVSAGLRCSPPEDLLAPEREPFASLGDLSRLTTLRTSAPDNEIYRYLLDGGGQAPPPHRGSVSTLILLLETNDLPTQVLARLKEILRAEAECFLARPDDDEEWDED